MELRKGGGVAPVLVLIAVSLWKPLREAGGVRGTLAPYSHEVRREVRGGGGSNRRLWKLTCGVSAALQELKDSAEHLRPDLSGNPGGRKLGALAQDLRHRLEREGKRLLTTRGHSQRRLRPLVTEG